MVNSSFNVFIKKSFLLLLLLFGLGLPVLCQPLLSLDWMNLLPQSHGSKIRSDNAGNIIVIGNSENNNYNHITTIKYNNTGIILWKKVYNDPLNQFLDLASDIAIDSLDNIYVGGTVNMDGSGTFLNGRSILIKYDTDGNLKWKREYGNNVGMDGGGSSIQIFQNKYIYLAGYMDSSNGNGFYRSFLAQYDSSGALNWTHIDSSSFETYARDIAIDKLGNVYTCGVTACCLPGYNIFASKFNLAGNGVWSTVVTDSTHPYATPYECIIDDSANLFISAQTGGITTNTGFDSYLVKLDSSGMQRWTLGFFKDSMSLAPEGVSGIVLDSKENCFIFGYSGIGPGGSNFLASIGNKTGQIKWMDWYYDKGFIRGILSKDSLLFLTGQDTASNLILYAYDTLGSAKWSYHTFCECYANDLLEIDSAIFLTGINYQPFSSSDDSLMTCRINIDSINGLYAIRGKNDLESAVFFPNPFTNELKIQLKHSIYSGIIKVYNIHGIRVYENPIKSMTTLLGTSLWKPGIYLIEIETDKYSIRKLISRN